MPQPVVLHKGTEIVHNVYLSELQAWLDDGWAISEPQTIEEKPVKQSYLGGIMPQPVVLYKGTEVVRNVYLSELQAWLDNGWSTEPQAIEEKPVNQSRKKASDTAKESVTE
jgi:hypothetical protein